MGRQFLVSKATKDDSALVAGPRRTLKGMTTASNVLLERFKQLKGKKPKMETLAEAQAACKFGDGRGLDIVCPVACGRCCVETKVDVRRAVHVLPTNDGPMSRKYRRCSHLGLAGCQLRRSNRPVGCTGYLCQVAEMVIIGEMTVDHARQITKDVYPWLYRRYDTDWKEALRSVRWLTSGTGTRTYPRRSDSRGEVQVSQPLFGKLARRVMADEYGRKFPRIWKPIGKALPWWDPTAMRCRELQDRAARDDPSVTYPDRLLMVDARLTVPAPQPLIDALDAGLDEMMESTFWEGGEV